MRLTLPPPVPEPDPPAFPLAGVLAPLVASAVLYAITRSPLTLAFAALSPVMAVASLLDGRRGRRRALRRAESRRARLLERVRADVDAAHAALRADLDAEAAADARARPGGAVPVVLGRGRVPSGIELTGGDDDRDRELIAWAAVLEDAPVTADARAGVGVVGAPVLAEAVRRGLATQARRAGTADAPLFAARTVVELGGPCATVLEVLGPARARVLSHPDRALRVPVRPELGARPPDEGDGPLPLDDLGLPAGGLLPARFLVGGDGPVDLDLAADGPHAVVGGTTGSGKSELLVAWAVALARASPPSRLALLLLDFKGGTAFDRLAAMPHVAGVVTDLDPAESARAADGLAAEVRRREEVLRAAGLRGVEGSGLPRLVVIVDEVQALLESRPTLAGVLTDIASRGRALGVHLVLGGQRPAGVLREALLANCGLRLSLRVLDPSDSVAVLGVPGAAALPSRPGSVLVGRAGERPAACRVALAAALPPGGAEERAAPVWLPALAPPLPPDGLGGGAPGELVLGRVDRPAERAQPVAVWRPARDGALLIAGARGSGRSTVLAGLAAADPRALLVAGAAPDGGERLWDALVADTDDLLLVDDADLALAGLGDAAVETAELLTTRVRRGRIALAVRGQPPPGLRAPAFGRVLVLRCGREEATMLGVDGGRWSSCPPPGGGWLDGEPFQSVTVPVPAAPAPVDPPLHDWAATAVLVTARPGARLTALRGLLGGRAVDLRTERSLPAGAVGVLDADSWQGAPQLWALPGTVPILFDGCTAGELRAVGRRRGVPPALSPLPGRAWRLPVDGSVERVLLSFR